MNWLFILLVLLLAASVARGIYTGFLRVAYNFVEWILIFIFITWASPYVSGFLTDYTSIPMQINEACDKQLHQWVESGAAEELLLQSNVAGISELAEIGVLLPSNLVSDMLEKAGVYEQLSVQLSDMALRGLSYLLTMLLAVIVFYGIRKILKLVDKIPVINEVNRAFGGVAGILRGIIFIWIFFGFVIAFGTMPWARFVMSYIYENPLLTWLYENNMLLSFLLQFL